VPAIDTKGVFTLEEFNFPHAVIIHEAALKPETLLTQYRKLFTYLELDKHPGMYLTSLF